jgi:acyl transferase domain-containing protein/acyl carrier protein
MEQSTSSSSTDIAIIGIAGRFPRAGNPEELWRRLSNGEDCISFFNDEELRIEGVDERLLSLSNYVRASPVIEGIEYFDAAFFGVTPRDAELMDPQHRLFMESCWEALENAGYDPSRYSRDIGLFAGARTDTYLIANLASHKDIVESVGPFHLGLGNDLAFLTTRISHGFDLRGPSCSLHIACSTSLVAVHLACQSLLLDECQMALAGGVAINVPHKVGYLYEEGSVMSPDGHCRVFDAEARGTIFGSGVGVVVLKRLEDALTDGDFVHAIIKGSAVNNDGATKASFTAPGIQGQIRVIREAQNAGGVKPETISYVECHGTGTLLGDAVEIRALTKAFRGETKKQGFCAVGSVKSNVGHLDAAAGITGLIKVVQSLKHRMLPPSLHFKQPNPQIDFAHSPFYVNTALTPWKSESGPRRAGVSAFGVGGTNAHVIVEEAPAPKAPEKGRDWQVLPLSARTETALQKALQNLANHLRQDETIDLADAAFTLQMGRRAFPYRWAGVCSDVEQAVTALQGSVAEDGREGVEEGSRKVAFLFPGQGSQYAGMGQELYEKEKVFRQALQQCAEILKPELGIDLCAALYQEASGEVEQTWLAQPGLFAVEYGMAQLWMSWGVEPQALLGHSLGEYTAACLAGVMSLEEALGVVVVRGQLMQRLPLGGMLAVGMGEAQVGRMLKEGVSLAAINAADLCVVSGRLEAIERLEKELQEGGVSCKRLRTSHAFHHAMVEPILGAFLEKMRQVRLRAPGLPFISNVSGRWIQDQEAQDPEYWVKHLRQPVQFERGLKQLVQGEEWMLVEAGPGQGLKRLAQKQGAGRVVATMPGSGAGGSETETMLRAVGQLWSEGVHVNWQAFHAGVRRNRIPMPTYPFERKRYWIDPPPAATGDAGSKGRQGTGKTPNVSRWFWYPSWKLSCPIGIKPTKLEPGGTWTIFLDNKGLGLELGSSLQELGQQVVTVYKGESFFQSDKLSYRINPEKESDYRDLMVHLHESGWRVENLLHLWSLDSDWESGRKDLFFDQCQSNGLLSLLHVTHTLIPHPSDAQYRIWVVCSNAAQVESQDRVSPEKTGILALCKVLPQEDQSFTTRVIDIDSPQTLEDRRHRVECILGELQARSADTVVAYRETCRWTQSYERISAQPEFLPENALRREGVYLITGGLGAVGILIAEWLARTAKARLVLVGRSPLPPRKEWQDILDQSQQSEQSRRIEKLLALEQLGTEVEVVCADVSDLAQMQEVFRISKNRFGRIDGIIHAAGITSGPSVFCLASDTGKDACEIQARPKAKGLLVLQEIVHDTPVDFVLCISSNAAVLGGLGFTAYAAANLFMDAFVQRQRLKKGKTQWISTDWDHWPEETKKLANFHTSMDEFAMTSEEAKEAFFRALLLGQSGQLIVSTGDLQQRVNLWISQQSPSQDALSGPTPGLPPKLPRPKVKTVYVEPRNKNEKKLAEIWEEALGVEKVGVNDDFFELGGHSLLATKLVVKIRGIFGTDLPLAKLFEGPTVSQMASYFVDSAKDPNEAGSPATKDQESLVAAE